MAKIVLDTVTGGYDLSVINNNFDKIETELNNKVMYRDNPVGEPNTYETDVDANSKRIFNLPAPTMASEAARLQDIQGLLNGLGSLVQFTPYKNISSINLQSAIQEEIDDLESTSTGNGSALIGYSTESISVKTALDKRIPEIASYAALRMYSGTLTVFYVQGISNIFDGGSGVFRVDPSDTTSADNGGTVLVDAINRRWKRENITELNVKWFGAKGDGITDDATAIQSALNEAVTQNIKSVIFPSATGYKLNSGLVVDTSKVFIDFRGNKIDFSGMSSGTAIKLRTSEDDPNAQNPLNFSQATLSNGYFLGPGSASINVLAILIVDDLGVGVKSASGTSVYNCSFVNFAKDVQFGDGAFCSSFTHCNFTHLSQPTATTYSINAPSGVTNAGERINFTDCMWNNRNLILNHANGNGSMRFVNCSLDYVETRMVTITDGSVYFTECHFEANTNGDVWFYVGGENAALYVKNAEVVVQAARTFSIFYSDSMTTTFGVSLDSIRIGGSQQISAVPLIGGTGVANARDITTFLSYGQPLISTKLNLINNGAFESTNINEWNISGPVSRVLTQFHTGVASLQLQGQVGSVTFAQTTRACLPNQVPSAQVWYKSSGVTGSGVTPTIALEYLDSSGATVLYTTWLTLATDAASWTLNEIKPHSRTPAGVANVRLTISIPAGSSAPFLWVDDIVLNVV